MRLALTPLLAALSVLYGAILRLRAWLYQTDMLLSDSCGAYVVSIGNLQAGGTGKTPVVAFFAKRWRGQQRVGIVSRGYGRESTGSLAVDTSPSAAAGAAQIFGDEPTWLAQTLGQAGDIRVPVQVGENRTEAARDLIIREGTKLILLDDGFQHLQLRRSFDIVLIDVSAPGWHWHVLPWGRLREPKRALARADAILLTKTDRVSAERADQIEKFVAKYASKLKLPILRFCQVLDWPSRSEEKLVLAAGLANSNMFFEMARDHASKPIVAEAIGFRDHFPYDESDVQQLKRTALASGARRVLVTEKDEVKLRPIWASTMVGEKIELVSSRLEVRPARALDVELLTKLDALIFKHVQSKRA